MRSLGGTACITSDDIFKSFPFSFRSFPEPLRESRSTPNSTISPHTEFEIEVKRNRELFGGTLFFARETTKFSNQIEFTFLNPVCLSKIEITEVKD
jgi:hypothetical protein